MIEPTPEEDEAFNEIERQARQRKELVRSQIEATKYQKMMHQRGIGFLRPKTAEEFHAELRNNVIEEVARAIENMQGFGKDTVNSFAVFIRGLK